ncbi:MAG: hypothetical protein WKF59_26870 [Chitinophagaceae bacterium]
MLLDILATILSGGLSTHEISRQKAEINVSQVFIAINISKLHNSSAIAQALDQIIEDYKNAEPDKNLWFCPLPRRKCCTNKKRKFGKGNTCSKTNMG